MVDLALLAAIVTGLVLINGLYVAAEFAVIGVRPTRMEKLAEEGNAAASALLPIIRSPERLDNYIAACQTGITAASLGLGMYGEHELEGLLVPLVSFANRLGEGADHAVAILLAVALLTFLHVVVGEMVPKSLALRDPEATAFAVARPMAVSRALFAPLVSVLNGLGTLALRLLRIPASGEHQRNLTADELAHVIGESAAGGLIAQREHQILLNIFDFTEREVHQVMTPRTRMEAFPIDIGPEDLARGLAASRHTRFPVYEGDPDHIVGTLHLKDFVRWQLVPDGPFDLRALARPARMVPEHMPAAELMAIFRQQRGQMAMVIDEYGGTAGLVTLEDIAEELVGEMRDEFDAEPSAVRVLKPGVLDVRGDLQLLDLAEYMPLPGDRPDVDTVGGLLVTLLGRPAREGDEVRLGSMTLTARRVIGMAVDLVRVVHHD